MSPGHPCSMTSPSFADLSPGDTRTFCPNPSQQSTVRDRNIKGAPSTRHGEQLPGARNAFQLMLAAVKELDARPDNKVLDGPGDQHFARRCQRPHAGRDVDRQASKIVAANLALAGVQTDAQVDAELPSGFGDGPATADGTGRTVERCHKAVPGGVDLPATKPPELVTHRTVVGVG